jgi:carboxypeptidase family protein/TonB-dependent receptor-like protein
MRVRDRFGTLVLIGLLWGSWAAADITRSGEVVGTVKGEDGSALPGATVTLSGATLIQKEITQTTDSRGAYRFLNLNPGTYTLTFSLQGFATKDATVNVNVGRSTVIDIDLALAKAAEQVVVHAEAPLVDKTTPQFQTNLSAGELAQIPSTRRYIDVVDTAPGLDNRMAFGAGGNVDGYDKFGFGAATNQYTINGVTTSNLQFGNTWVNPNYDTIQEVQIVGPGASAEYSQFTGATVNVITKTGTNDFHGGFTVYGTADTFAANNTGGIIDLAQNNSKYAVESNAFLGGPIVKEKLLFFTSGAYNEGSSAPPDTTFFDHDKRPSAQLRLDFLASTSNTFSMMYDYEHITLTDQGLQPVTGPEVGYFRQQHTNYGYLSWVSTWSPNTVSELKYGGGEGFLERTPNNTTDPEVYNGDDGYIYNSTGFFRNQRNWKHDVRGNATHYVDDFLGGTHEFKGGADYEWQQSKQDLQQNQNVFFFILTVAPGLQYVEAGWNYNYHQATTLKRPGAYLQDKATWKNLTLNLGVRYDNPVTTDKNTGKDIFSFNQWSPRVGLTYDFSGKGTTVFGASYGRYYDKVPTYGPGYYSGTGATPVTYYGAVTNQTFDPHDWQAISNFILQPQYITVIFDAQAIPVRDGTKGPFSDLISARIEQQLGTRFAASLSYLYRHTKDYITQVQAANPDTYTPFQYTSDFTGQTFTYYSITPPSLRKFDLGNLDFWFQKSNMLILELRSHPTAHAFLNASATWEHTTGTRDNNECGVLTLCTNGVDGDPNRIDNPFYNTGQLSQSRPFNVKVQGAYQFPWNITASADFRWFSGRHYGAVAYSYELGDPRFNDPYAQAVYLEPKDARKEPNSVLLNLRAQKDFLIGNVTASLIVDVLNATNAAIDFNTNIQNDPYGFYAKESAKRGERVSNFGQPYSVTPPRQTRFGLRLVF